MPDHIYLTRYADVNAIIFPKTSIDWYVYIEAKLTDEIAIITKT